MQSRGRFCTVMSTKDRLIAYFLCKVEVKAARYADAIEPNVLATKS
jgi:hypothetical protein